MSRRTVSTLLGVVVVVAGVVVAGMATGVAGTAGSSEAGRQVFEANCAMCHGGDATGMMGMHPSLRGAVDRLTREGVEVAIRNGRDTRPPMPAFEGRLSDEEIADVIAYIDSLPDGPRNFGPRSDGEGGGMMGDGPMMDDSMMDDSMMDGTMMDGGTTVLLVVVAVLALLVLAVAVTVWLVRRGTDTGGSASPARQELDRRYAAGEMDRDEYLQRRRDLET